YEQRGKAGRRIPPDGDDLRTADIRCGVKMIDRCRFDHALPGARLLTRPPCRSVNKTDRRQRTSGNEAEKNPLRAGLSDFFGKTISVRLSDGGYGWTRTTDPSIMS